MGSGKGRKFDPTEELGINAVQKAVLTYGWIFRDKRQADFGIDGEIEIVSDDQTVTGKLLGVQIKSGPSFFKDATGRELRFYATPDHRDYWLGYAVPVGIAFHNPDNDETIWQFTDSATSSGKSWRIDVPRTNTFNADAKASLAQVAAAGKTLNQVSASRMVDSIVGDVSKGQQAAKPKEVTLATEQVESVAPLLQAEFGEAGLSAAALSQISKLLDEKLAPSRQTPTPASVDAGVDPRRASEDPTLHAKIDQLRDIKNEGDPAVAYRKLEALLPQIDRETTPFAYFRALSTRAAAALDLGRARESCEGFEEAFALEPHNANALANMGLAALIRREHVKAREYAQASIDLPDYPGHVLTILLAAVARLDYEGDPRELIPVADRDKPEAIHALLEFLRVRDDPSWPHEAIAAHEAKPDDQGVKRLWALGVLELATTDGRFVAGGQSDVPVEDVRRVAEFLRDEVEHKIINGYADIDDVANEATNAAIAFRIIDDYPSAVAFLKRVQGYVGHNPNIMRMLGLSQAMSGDEADALETLATIPEDGEAQLLRGEILGRGDAKAGLELVRGLAAEIIPEHHTKSRLILTASLAQRASDPRLADALNALRADEEVAPYATIIEVRHRSASGEDDEVLAAELSSLADQIKPDAPFSLRLTLAESLKRHGAFIKASRLLDGHIDTERDSDAARLYLTLLASAGRDTDFFKTLKALPEAVRQDPETIWLTTVHAFNRGDLDKAERQSKKLAERDPKTLKPLLLHLEALVRRRRDNAIREILAGDVESLEAEGIGDQTRLARLLVGFGYPERGLALLYRLMLENRDNPRLWTNFGGLVLGAERGPDFTLDVTGVAVDTSVTLSFEGGGAREIVVEPNAYLRKLDPDSREPEHQDVAALMGLSTGDTFTLPDGRGGHIADVRHKFVARMQTVLQDFENRFPSANGFRSIRVDVEAEGGLDAIKAVLKDRRDFVESEADAYEKNQLPLAIFAHRVGISPIDAAGGLAESGRYFQVAFGNEAERIAANKSIDSNAQAGAVVDAQTFWTIWDLGVTEVVQATVGKLHYTAACLYELHERLERLTDHKQDEGQSIMSIDNGQIVLKEFGPDEVKAAADILRSAIQWLEENATLAAVEIPDALPDEIRQSLADLPKPIFDEVFVAKKLNILLLVDDLRMRLWGRALGVEKSSWLHWILGHAVDKGMADMSSYATWSAKLIARRQNYIGLGPQVMVDALRADAAFGLRQPGEIFLMLARCFGGKAADVESHIRVVAQTIYLIWDDMDLRYVREAATGILLDRLTIGRPDDYKWILTALIRVFRKLNRAVSNYIVGWIKGHFISLN